MKLFCFFLFFCVFCSDLMAKKSPKSHSYKIKVMTFNLWHSGTTVINGLAKVVEQIKQAKADIVALQEVYIGYSALFATLLGPEWSGVEMYDGQLDSGIITRHKIDKTLCDKTSFGLGCLISLKENPSVKLVVWSVHLSYLNYPPYIACLKKETPPLINLRSDNLQELAKKESFQRHLREMTDTPVIVAGDFNEPSHLDWIESTRDQHCGQIAPYNTSLQMYQWGFTDAFRFIKPDPIAFPGITWSVTDKMGDGLFYPSNLPEPQDRIDYIYYGRGEKLRCTGSFKLPNKGVNNPKPNYFLNDWPSDHFAVIADFDLAE